MARKILYIDLDNTLADFDGRLADLSPEIRAHYEGRFDHIPGVYSLLKPMPGAVAAYRELARLYDTYILSTAPWANPTAWTDKLQWVQLVFGAEEADPVYKRLIITHHKDLNVGDYLVDDQPAHGAAEFTGEWLHFGEGRPYPDWSSVVGYLRERA
ncbi:MAG TPA: hypothetical protein VNR37_09385 [Microbacteriaceae bacterium]|nr:hypothetical protein [Microbacteriaceae bacterium]